MQDGEPNDFIHLVANDHVVICKLAIRGMTRFLEVDVQDVGLRIAFVSNTQTPPALMRRRLAEFGDTIFGGVALASRPAAAVAR